MENNDTLAGFGFGLVTGVIIGGVVALLYAPKSGIKTRQLIKDKVTEVVDTVKDETNEVMNTVKDETDEVMDTIKDAAHEASRRGHAAVKALRS